MDINHSYIFPQSVSKRWLFQATATEPQPTASARVAETRVGPTAFVSSRSSRPLLPPSSVVFDLRSLISLRNSSSYKGAPNSRMGNHHRPAILLCSPPLASSGNPPRQRRKDETPKRSDRRTPPTTFLSSVIADRPAWNFEARSPVFRLSMDSESAAAPAARAPPFKQPFVIGDRVAPVLDSSFSRGNLGLLALWRDESWFVVGFLCCFLLGLPVRCRWRYRVRQDDRLQHDHLADASRACCSRESGGSLWSLWIDTVINRQQLKESYNDRFLFFAVQMRLREKHWEGHYTSRTHCLGVEVPPPGLAEVVNLCESCLVIGSFCWVSNKGSLLEKTMTFDPLFRIWKSSWVFRDHSLIYWSIKFPLFGKVEMIMFHGWMSPELN